MGKIEPAYSGVLLNIAITSDNHVDVRCGNLKQRLKIMRKTLQDVQNSTVPMDAYITVGDTVSRGLAENWETAQSCFAGMHPAKQMIFTLGNHDSWGENGYEGYAEGIKLFYQYSKAICGYQLEKPYFTKIINGYHLIFLGSDGVPENEDCAFFSEEELHWFREQMQQAAISSKPIFVFCHQSVNAQHGLPRTWAEKEDPTWGEEIGGIGEASDTVKSILSEYKNVYYFSGHSHMGLNGERSLSERGFASFEVHDGVHYINLPCLTRPNHHGGNEKTGQGLLLEVYEDKVLIRPRRFSKHRMNKKIAIQNGKPYLEAKIL